jgi:hypothetical protein
VSGETIALGRYVTSGSTVISWRDQRPITLEIDPTMMGRRGGGTVFIRELTPRECADLIASGGVGRVAVCTQGGPEIYPVNYTVVEGAIVFRTSAHSGLGLALLKRPSVVFEVDQLEHERMRGWSVVAHATAEPMEDLDEIAGLRPRWHLAPWAGGTRNLRIRLRWQELAGRRVGDW